MKSVTIGLAVAALTLGAMSAAQGNGRGNGHGGEHQAPPADERSAGSMESAGHAHDNVMRAVAPGQDDSNTMRAHPQARRDSGGGEPATPTGSHPDNAARPAPPNAGREHGEGRNGPPATPSPAAHALADPSGPPSEPGARPAFDFAAARRGPIPGCPPGLAHKANGCMPPGLAQKRPVQPGWWGLGRLPAGAYYRDGGYLVRTSGNAINAYVPLLAGALAVGNPWPRDYASPPLPDYLVRYYDLGPADNYRYADGVVYRVDPASSAITGIAALLTGSNIRVGSPMPPGYDVYNVPYAFRAQYPDGPNARYRYSDGTVYRIDPATGVVKAAIEMIR